MTFRVAIVLMVFALSGCVAAAGTRTAGAASRDQADDAYASGDTTAALAAYRQLATSNASDPVVWTRIGNLELLQNHPHQAADAYDKAVQLDPSDTEAWHNMVIIRLRQASAMLERERASLRAGDPRDAALQCEQARLAAVLKSDAGSETGCKQ